jgi:hypothetical protein
MPDREGPARAVYDHTEEEPRPPGRRRRQVADWGVGEELFDGMPGRRFERRGEDHRIPRGGVDDGRRTIVIADGETSAEPPEVVEAEFASREEALQAREEHDAVWAGDEPFAERTSDPVWVGDEPFAERTSDESLAREEDEQPLAEERDLAGEGHRTADGIVRGGVEGRRTVKIGGHPAQFHSTPTRRRPSRTVHERVGPRPDRIAAWAFALGLLLILIAIATANI